MNSLASSLSATVCDLPCVYDQAASTDANTYKCRAPLLGTEYSAKTYTGLVAESNWLTQHNTNGIELELVTSGNAFGAEAFDQDVSNRSGTTASCSLGQRIKSGHVGTISKIRYFLPQTQQAEEYKGGKFQTSDDGTTWTDLFTIDSTPMEGWNSWDRITSGTTGSQHVTYKYVKYIPNPSADTLCDFSEIEIIGKIILGDTDSFKTCDAKLFRDTTQLASEASAVRYANDNTPTITALGPSRYLVVAGG